MWAFVLTIKVSVIADVLFFFSTQFISLSLRQFGDYLKLIVMASSMLLNLLNLIISPIHWDELSDTLSSKH